MENSVDPDKTAPIGALCSGSTLFASILNSYKHGFKISQNDKLLSENDETTVK